MKPIYTFKIKYEGTTMHLFNFLYDNSGKVIGESHFIVEAKGKTMQQVLSEFIAIMK